MITNGDVLIEVKDVHKVFGNSLHALNGVSETIRKGEVVVSSVRQDPGNRRSYVP